MNSGESMWTSVHVMKLGNGTDLRKTDTVHAVCMCMHGSAFTSR